jgi:hypothetical protein
MLEKSLDLQKRVPKYDQLFSPSKTEEIKKYEPSSGTVDEIMSKLKHGLQDRKSSVYDSVFRSYELAKTYLNLKINLCFGNDYESRDASLEAVHLSQELMLSCFKRDSKTALKKLRSLKKLSKKSKKDSPLHKMLSTRIDEKSDLAFLPACIEEEDFNIAKNLMDPKTGTGGEPILMIGIGYRGAWRIPEIFLEYQDLSDTPESKLYMTRYSPGNYSDTFPRLSWEEIRYLKELAKGRKIVIVGAMERLDWASMYFREMLRDGDPVSIIKVPLKLTEVKDTSRNGVDNGIGENYAENPNIASKKITRKGVFRKILFLREKPVEKTD